MDASRFDALTRILAGEVPRRRLLRGLTAGGLTAVLAAFGGRRPADAAVAKEVTIGQCCSCKCAVSGCCPVVNGVMYCTEATACLDCKPCGVAGGGVVKIQSGEAVLTLFALGLEGDANEGTHLVRWVDPAWEGRGLTLESVGIGSYGPLGDLKGVREITGEMLANGEGPYPFSLIVADVGPNGNGRDTVSLTVEGAADRGAGFKYAAEGTLVTGDLVGTWTAALPEGAVPINPDGSISIP